MASPAGSGLPKFLQPLGMRGIAVIGALVTAAVAIGVGFAINGMHAGFEFSQNQRVSATSELRLAFPEAMDHASVEENMIVPQGLQAEKKWDGETLVYVPTQRLEAGKLYEFTLGRRALKADGQQLGRDLVFKFYVAGAPSLSAHMPGDDATLIPAKATVALVFDRPMVALTQVQGGAAQARWDGWPVTISPQLPGRWRWLGTTTAEFVPDNGLTLATKYTVTVPAGIKTVSGDMTEKDFSWSFQTTRPSVEGIDPAADSDVSGPGTQVVLRFNQDIDLDSVRNHVKLAKQETPAQERRDARMEKMGSGSMLQSDANQLALKQVVYGKSEDDKGKMVTDKKLVVLVPAQPLEFASHYVVSLAADTRGTEGNLGTESDFQSTFSTVGDLTVTDGTYLNGSVNINFSNPIDDATLKANIVFDPPVAGWKDQVLETYEWTDNKQLSFYAGLEPSTTYKVTVKTGVKDKYGQVLKTPFEFSFKTDPVEPQAFIHSKGEFGIFERSKLPVFYLNAVNVSVLNLEFARLSFGQFLNIRKNERENPSGFTPALSEGQNYKKLWIKPPKSKPDHWESIPYDVQEKVGQTLTPGIYALSMSAPEYVETYNGVHPVVSYQYFALTDMAVTLKHSATKAMVWVTDMETGEPVPGAAVEFYSIDGKQLLSGKTDAQGFMETAFDIAKFAGPANDWDTEFWVTATKGDDMAFVSSNWNDGYRPYSFNNVYEETRGTDSSKFRLQSYTYTERPIYRAGDTVHFKGIVRLLDWDGKTHLPSSSRTAEVTISDPEGREVYNASLKVDAYGTFNGDFTTASGASLGSYSLGMQLDPGDDIAYQYGGTSFSVLAYRKPEYRVDVTPESEDIFNGSTLKAGVEGAYYFGAPMGGANVSWRAQTTDYFFNKYKGDGWYSFGLEDAWCWYDCTPSENSLTSGETKLDAAGRGTIAFPVNIDDKGVSQVVSVDVDVTDQNNQVVSTRTSVVVHKSKVYAGIGTDDYVVTPGDKAKIRLITLDTDGNPVASKNVKLQVYLREWNTIRKKGVDGEYYYDNEPKDTLESESSAFTGSDGKVTAEVAIPTGGEHRIVATVTDDAGREAKAGTDVYAWSSTYVNWAHDNNDRIDVLADKPEYKVGDTAKILVKSPYQGKGVKALVTVERENVLTKQVVDVTSNAMPIDVPITEEMVPNAYVSVVVVKPRVGETFNENGLDTGMPAFKIGYVPLHINVEDKKLHVSVKTDKERYGPREKVTVTLNTTDAAGNPVPAQLSLGVVDLSLLALSGFEKPDLTTYFYGERGLGVLTTQMLSQLVERFKPGSKGGGGGVDPETVKRGNFKDTAYWLPTVTTGADGTATVTFDLPDNLTTWQLLAIGSTQQSTFGAETTTILETKKVILRPVLPRFALTDDEVKVGAIVANFTNEEQHFKVTISGNGFVAQGESSKDITVAKDGQVKVIFPVKMANADQALINLKAQNAAGVDEVEQKIPLYKFGVEQANATSGETEDVATEKVRVPSKQEASTGTLSVSVSPTLATYLPAGLQYLATYPYGCAEQTTSGFLPDVALSRLQGFDAFSFVDPKTLQRNVSVGLQRLYGFQRSDGGFGYWENSERSYPYLTAYIVYALQLTQKNGYTVDSGVLDRAASYLKDQLRNPTDDVYMNDTTRAYILFALSEAGRSADVSLLNNLYDRRNNLPQYAKAQLAMALKTVRQDKKASTLMDDVMNAVIIDARGAHFEEDSVYDYGWTMHTDTVSSATILQALVRIQPDNPMLPKIVRYLLAVRENGRWDTTQSTSITLLAFAEYLDSTKELEADFTAGVQVGDKKVLDASFNAKNVLQRKEVVTAIEDLARGKDIDVKVGKDGKGRLYYDMVLQYFYTPDSIPPAEEGIGIVREMTPLTPKDAGLAVGTTQKVTLTITVPQWRHLVAVSSPLPGGMEAIDFNLKGTQQDYAQNVNQGGNDWSYDYYMNGLWRFGHIEFRDDQVFLFADELPPGVYKYEYLVRATTPGKFHYRPARAWEMYFPETFGQTSGDWLTIQE